MRRTTQFALIAAVAALAAGAGYFAYHKTQAPAAEVPAEVAAATAELFALQLPDAGGTPQAMSQWRGKVVVVNFWATWCPPCRKEIPDFVASSRTFADAPVQFVGLSIDTPDSVQSFAREFDVPYPLLIASPQVLGLAAHFGNASQGLPFTLIADREGRIRHVKLGTLNRAELEGKIRSLLAGNSG